MRHFVMLLFICNFLYPCSSFLNLEGLTKKRPCWPWDFSCDNGQCIPTILHPHPKCNGVRECDDNSDEKNCVKKKEDHEDDHEKIMNYFDYDYADIDHIACGEDEYKCKDGECIPKAKFCDVTEDCSDGSDEVYDCVDHLNCSNRFQCKDRHCVFNEWVCDGTKDCPDGSDESNCLLLKTYKTVSDCTIQNFQYLCENQRCIPLDAVCNKKNDCGDGSDEGAACTQSCSIKCNHECKQTPKGSKCVCKPGYKLQNDNRTCTDIDECQIYGTCDQGCVNSVGSYNCTCQTTYFLLEDHKTCKAHGGDAALVFSTKTKIIEVYLGKNIELYMALYSEIASNLNHSVGVAMNGNHVYWSDIEENRTIIVKSINRYNNQREVIVTTGLSESLTSIAVDWITENIYFTDEGNHHIGVCTNDGTYCTILVRGTEKPAGIVLLPTRGKMYWCDWGSMPRIAVAGMDGKNLDTFVYKNLKWPKSLTIDYPNDRLYWIDAKSKTIESIRLDGTDRRIILHDIIRDPFSLAVFENKLYWSDLYAHTIESCNKFTGKDWRIIFQTKQHQPYSVHIDHLVIKPKIVNPCFNRSKKCSELCLLNDQKEYTCACTLDKTLKSDNHTCQDSITHHLMIVDTSQDIFINYYHKMLGKPKITNSSERLSAMSNIMSDPTSGQIIMSKGYIQKNILRYEPYTNIFESVIKINSSFLDELAFDYIGNNIYGLNIAESSIEIYSIKTNARTVFYFTHQCHPLYITLAPEESKMYVAVRESFWRYEISIYEMQMNGLGKKEIIKDKWLGSEMLMCYDSDSKTLFVNIPFQGDIWMYSAKGSRFLRFGLKRLVSFTVANNNIFWVQHDTTALYWTNFTEQSNYEDVAFQMPVKSYSNKILVTLRKDAMSNHVCRRNNGMCSHVCLVSNMTSFICACPPKMELASDNRTCIKHGECLNHEYKCSEHRICIRKEMLCDGIKDCPNGEDEGKKHCDEKFKCLDNEFKCKNGQCIRSEDRCNKKDDCGDRSDEENCEKCKNGEFRCDDGTCIPNFKVCDFTSDCHDDSDETFDACLFHKCNPEDFTCKNHICIPAMFVCDTIPNCDDGEDEENCKHECKQGDFSCSNGNCISLSLKCDGNDDCYDGSDERNCSKLNHCTTNEYQCSNSTICLNKKRKCNGVPDCPRHDDEQNCSFCENTEFTCNNKLCIPYNWTCDKKDDCGDNSDEIDCIGNTKKIIKNSNKCDEFKCTRDGKCLSYNQVCDGVTHCIDSSDENGQCQTACKMNNTCEGVCHKTPTGAVCGCQDGYRLAADGISCEDINECKSDYSCSQICQNTEGSYKCLCYEEYILLSDKVTCKSIGQPMQFITVTDNDIREISFNLQSIETIYSLSGLSTSGLDVNIRRRFLYWSNDEIGTIKKFNLLSNEVITFSIVEHPRALAVDWITDNVYVNNNGQPNTIKVCNLDAQRCALVVKIEDKAKAGPLVVNPINRWLFWAETSWQAEKPSSKICRTDMIGADMKIIVSELGLVNGMSIDLLDSKLYWSDIFHKVIESSNFDGSERKIFLQTSIYHPLSISVFEQSLYWLMDKNGRKMQVCKLRGIKSCDEPFDLGTNNVHKLFTIVQNSRQPFAKNPCNENDCDYMCVLKNDNATCICSDGEIQINTTCTTNTSEPKNELKNGLKLIGKPSKHNMSSTYSVTIVILLVGVMLLCVYYFYQKNRLKLKPETDFSCSSIRFQNPSYDRRDEVEVTLDSLASNSLSPGQHEYINPIDNKYLSIKAMMESSECRQRSNQ